MTKLFFVINSKLGVVTNDKLGGMKNLRVGRCDRWGYGQIPVKDIRIP